MHGAPPNPEHATNFGTLRLGLEPKAGERRGSSCLLSSLPHAVSVVANSQAREKRKGLTMSSSTLEHRSGYGLAACRNRRSAAVRWKLAIFEALRPQEFC